MSAKGTETVGMGFWEFIAPILAAREDGCGMTAISTSVKLPPTAARYGHL